VKLMQVAKALFAGAATLFFAGAAPGCGPTAEGYCNKKCDCVPCTTDERALCVSLVEDSRTGAVDKGCQAEFDAYFSCLSSETTCVSGQIDDDGCEIEAAAASKCGAFLGNACDKLAADLIAKYAECGITGAGGGSGTSECSPAEAKVAACYDACVPKLDCECIKNPEGADCAAKLGVYSDCVIACQ
jgi:hypothetical protein